MARLILGEIARTLDPRYRLSIPPELAASLGGDGADCILAKERPGCLSLWSVANWQTRLDDGVRLVESKIDAGRLEGRLEEVQRLGRLLSTRQRPVQLAGRGRLIVPEGFREFLAVEPPHRIVFTWGWAEDGRPVPAGSTAEVAVSTMAPRSAARIVVKRLREKFMVPIATPS